ncbi:MAG: hypothetical protein M3Q33_08095 [Acidobacteriota bacterium]|nr:hypothetical protein [Acidobacteriota bacterium]
MFCPNCGKETNEQKFCRDCGLKVEKIFNILVKEIEEREKTSIQKRDDLFRKLGFVSLSLLFGLCFGFLFYLAVYYKFVIFGKEIMGAIGLTVMVFLGLLSLVFFNLPKFLDRKEIQEEFFKDDEIEKARKTEKLLSEGNFEPIPSVTENSTELLFVENKTKKL